MVGNTSPFRRSPPPFGQVGVSLLELLISMAIGLVLVVTIGYAYVGAKQSFRTQNALSRIQENARYAFEFMAHDLRMAGYVPANLIATAGTNIVNAPAGWDPNLINLFNLPLIGYEDTDPGVVYPAGIAPLRGDVVTVVHTDNETEYALAAHAEPTFTLTAASDIQVGDILVAADYTHAGVFQADSVAGTAVTYNTGTAGVVPGNSAAALGAFSGSIGSRKLYKLNGVSFFIAANPTGEPALFRQRLGRTGTAATVATEELVEGVQDMQLLYGVDTSNPADNSVDGYWLANQITAGTNGVVNIPGANAQDWWRRVLAVRASLIMTSRAGENVAASADGVMRRTITNTIAIRNRL